MTSFKILFSFLLLAASARAAASDTIIRDLQKELKPQKFIRRCMKTGVSEDECEELVEECIKDTETFRMCKAKFKECKTSTDKKGCRKSLVEEFPECEREKKDKDCKQKIKQCKEQGIPKKDCLANLPDCKPSTVKNACKALFPKVK